MIRSPFIVPQSRLCVNAVTLEEFDEPIKISIFVKDVFSGFTMVSSMISLLMYPITTRPSPKLNLKNDILRKRFDSLKYDIKKIEEGMS
jgi:hypothetical protein